MNVRSFASFICLGLILAALSIVGFSSLHLEASQNKKSAKYETGFVSLLNKTDLKGWQGDLNGKELKNGILHWTGGGSIWTVEEYADFEFRFDFKMSPGANNGLAIRWDGEGDPAYLAMCELQILDNQAEKYAQLDPRQYHGSAYGMAAAKRGYLKAPGKWNSQIVRVVDSKIHVTLNGTVILDTDLSQVSEYLGDRPHPGKTRTQGHLGFAGHGDEHQFQFRKLRIKRL